MHNLIRIYNQNRIKIWIIVIGIIISITVIQNLNKSIRDENNKKNNKIIEQQKNTSIYKNESKYGGVGGRNHEQMMDIVGLTGKYGQDYILDDKKRSAMEGIVASKVSNKKQQEQVMQLFAEAHGQGAYYKNISKKSRMQEKTENDRKSSIVTGANVK